MTPTEAVTEFVAALAHHDATVVVEALDPQDLERWRTQELFHLAIALDDHGRRTGHESEEVHATVSIWDTSRAPELIARHANKPLPFLPGAPTLGQVSEWPARTLLIRFLEGRFAQAAAVGDTRGLGQLHIIGELCETPDLVHVLYRDPTAAPVDPAHVEHFTLRNTGGTWRLCLGFSLLAAFSLSPGLYDE
jgi:hypothetical protein